MGTDPSYERRGAASKLVRWGIDRCDKEGVPAYLERTLNAAAFYEKMGFRALDRISLTYDLDGENKDWVYEEIVFRYDPA
jgi:predicted N-acetyltransferase YhbS